MLPPAYLPIPQPCRKQGLRCRVEEPGRGYFYLGVYVFFFRPFSWFLLGKTLFLTGSLSFPLVLLGFSSGKHYFPTDSVSFS